MNAPAAPSLAASDDLPRRRARRNVLLLALCQALYMSGTSLVLTVTALAGSALTTHKLLGTLPLSLQFIATMATTIPASLLMRRLGRRAGFALGAACGIAGAALSLWALLHGDFILFCLGAVLIGMLNGFAVFYRFAAADTADPAFRAKAISLVMAGGVIASFVGPNLARYGLDAISGTLYAGSFVALAGLHLLTLLLLAGIDIPRPAPVDPDAPRVPLGHILRRPAFVVAMVAAVAGYASMNLVMTSTPLSMVDHHHPFDHAATVIQWHVFAMFAPSFFTGHLIARFGVHNVIVAGAALILACVGVNLAGTDFGHFLVALVLLGVGWNFMYIGATTLLTTTHNLAEKAKVQGINEFVIFGSVALASLASGAVQQEFGWLFVNLVVAPLVVAGLLAVLWLKLSKH
ncbi:MAG TPA: MFS transporter [Alphaproteobacteria bacterium]|jgi:MFS family permease